jgi:hypothetical protein
MSNLQEDLAAMKAAQSQPRSDLDVRKAFTTGLGLVNYDLQPVALNLYPVITMLRNEIARVPGNGDTATRWKAITGINTTNQHIGISEGQRGGAITTTLSSFTAAYIPMGLEDSVTFEAELAAQGFDDARAKASLGLLRSMMIAEEKHLFAGNGSHALGKTPTPTASGATTGGTIPDGTYLVSCVALTHLGYERSSLTSGVPSQLSKLNADGTTDTINAGAAQVSDAGSTGSVASANTNTVSAYVTAVEGAAGYAWYVGTSGNQKLEAITKINSVKLTALAGTHQALASAPAADYSSDSTYDYNGLFHFAQAALGSTIKVLATGTAGTGSKLTSDGAGGIQEISDVCQLMWDNYKLGPQEILCSAYDLIAINKLVIANGGAPIVRFNGDFNSGAGMTAGLTIGSLLNPVTQQLMRLRVHPNAVQGTILLYAKEIPYPLSGVGNVMQVKCRRDYYQIEWPWVTRKYQFGVYLDSVLQHYFPAAIATISNIGL